MARVDKSNVVYREAAIATATLMILLSAGVEAHANRCCAAMAESEEGSGGQLADRMLKITAKTNDGGTSYGYGQLIPLNVTIFNSGDQTINLTASDLKPYAGLGYACAGVLYFDFLVLNGDYSKEIKTYGDLLRLKENAVYVMDPPFRPHSCLLPSAQSIYGVTIYPGVWTDPNRPDYLNDGDSKFTIDYVSKSGGNGTGTGSTLAGIYLKEKFEGGITNETGKEYVKSSQLLPPGKYTVVAFTMSGQISKPLVIEVRAAPEITFFVIMGAAAVAGVAVLLILPKYQKHNLE